MRELHKAGCFLLRHGGSHDIYVNPGNGRRAPIPRHTEIRKSLCEQIKDQLGIKSEK